MCKECGCDGNGETRINDIPAHKVESSLIPLTRDKGLYSHGQKDGLHLHSHEKENENILESGDDAGHEHDVHERKTAELSRPVLEYNQRLAERNRGFFIGRKIFVINMLSSPGSGKTTLVYETARRLRGSLRAGVIVGDLATQNDADVLRGVGIPVVQVNTGTACHLDAEMVARALAKLPCDCLDILIIENVGNLVCPALFDLGEHQRVVLLSTTEGEDKPLKYPPLFHTANVAIITKIDLAEAARFKREVALANLRKISHHAVIFELSAKTGAGMECWLEYLENECRKIKSTPF